MKSSMQKNRRNEKLIEYQRLGTGYHKATVMLKFTEEQLNKARHVFDIMAKREGLIDSSPMSDELMIAYMFGYGIDAMIRENKGK